MMERIRSTRNPVLLSAMAAAFVLTCSGEGRQQTGRVIRDAGTWLAGMDGGAFAQDAGGTGGVARMVTADTDATRLESGVAFPGAGTQLVAGPIVVTDLLSQDGIEFWIASAGACGTPGLTFETGGDQGASSARILIPAGMALCAAGTAGVLWSGFHPYP